MNMAFGLIPMLTAGIPLIAGYLLLKRWLPERKVWHQAYVSFCALVVLAVAFNSIMTYGPRVEVAKTRVVYSPERGDVEDAEPFTGELEPWRETFQPKAGDEILTERDEP